MDTSKNGIDLKKKENEMIKVTVRYNGEHITYEIPQGKNIADVIEQAKEPLGIPDIILFRVDESIENYDYVLNDGETIVVRQTEAIYGANDINVDDYIGKKLKTVIKEKKEILSMSKGKLDASVNGVNVTMNHKIAPGDRIEFSKEIGHKL